MNSISPKKYVPFLRENGKYSYVEYSSLSPVFDEIEFDAADLFSEGYAVVTINGKSGFINEYGDLVIPPFYDSASGFSEGLAMVEQEGLFGFVNVKGEIIVPIRYDNANDFYNGTTEVESGNLYGIVDKNGKEIFPPSSGEVVIFSEGLAHISDEWGYNHGFIDIQGKIVISKIYYSAREFSSGLAPVE